ncbi:MAG: RNA polymerase sigma factor [Sandaracinus sp.]
MTPSIHGMAAASTETPRPAYDAALAEQARAAQAGDRAVLQALLVRIQPRLRNLVRYFLRGDAHVDEVAQEALVAIVRGLPTFRHEAPFEAWADRITARLAFAHIRRQAKERDAPRAALQLVPDPASGPAPDAYVQRRDLVRALDAIPRDQRDAVVLHHVVGMTVPEIATEVGAPEETVRSRLRLGMQRLRDILEALPGGSR